MAWSVTGVRRFVAAGAVCGVLMTVSVASPDESATHKVTIEADSYLFAPQVLSIKQGDRVRWTNNDKQMHMIVTAKPDSNGKELEIYHRLDPGTSFDHQFAIPTAYYYYCAIHFQMWGTISVNP